MNAPAIRKTLQCSRCRCLIENSSEAMTIRIGDWPARRTCQSCAEYLQIEACSMPTLNSSLPIDPTPEHADV